MSLDPIGAALSSAALPTNNNTQPPVAAPENLGAAINAAAPPIEPAPVNQNADPMARTLDAIRPKVTTPEEPATEEEPETPPETTPETEEAPDSDNFFSDPLKNKAAEPDSPDNQDAELLNEFKALQEDPDFKLFREYKKAGKTLGDLTKDFEYIDYKKLTSDQLVAEYGKLKGYTPDEVDEALSEINGLGKLSRDREIEAMQGILDQNQQGKREILAGDAQKQTALHEKIRTQYRSEVEQIQGDMVGKDYNGVKFNQETSKQWQQFASTFNLQRQDGTIATEVIFKAFLSTLIPQIQSTAASKSHSQGREEILKEISRPVKDAPAGKLPVAQVTDVKHDPKGLTQSMTQAPSQR